MDAFEKAGYGQQSVGFGQRCAVLVVDFQKAFTDGSSPLGQSIHLQRAVDNTVTLLTAAERCGIPIAACRTAWYGPTEMPYWKVTTLYDGSFYHGHPLTELDPRIDIGMDNNNNNNLQFTKSAPSIFFRTPLPTWLTKQGIDTTIITGCTTSGCIRASVVDSFSYGYRTIVVEDCCGDQDEQAHYDNLRDVGRRYADVVPLADVLRHFAAMATTTPPATTTVPTTTTTSTTTA